ncbi:RagB/SusD family nutrient uptake outer membrane protein [Hallella multisaccharivorax]|uniref:RagB/SusD family nutrient uptake outer membrane protein n=1 Tax=Hallella multisaccharivorax TaxID=310514 RepID=UPI00360C1CC8
MKAKILGLSLAAVFTMISCSDFLDEPLRGTQTIDNYFTSPDEVSQQVTGCYQTLAFDDWWQIYKQYVMNDVATDDEWMGNTTQDPGDYYPIAMYTGNTVAAGNAVQNFYQYRFKGIFQCNATIERSEGVMFQDESLKKRLISEAKFIRAYEYFELARSFGGMPLMTKITMPSEAKGIARASLDSTYAFIEKDLLEAIPNLPLRSQQSATDLGRITKGAAQGILAKVYLYQQKYKEAETQLKAIINSGEYKLLPDFGDVWSIDHNNSPESLFEIQTNSDISYNLGERISVVVGSRDDSGWSWGLPTSNLEKAFEEEGDSIRLRYTIIHDRQTDVPGDPTYSKDNPYVITPSKHKSARCNMKLYIPKAKRLDPYDAPHNALNYRLLRYADVLLMYAEVENALDNDAEARKALNEVRERVKLKDITSSGKQLRNDIRKERRLELALEGNRLFDLRRWTDDNNKKAICNVMGPNGSFVVYNTRLSTDKYELENDKESQSEGAAFQEGRDELYPIPNSEIIESNGIIKQNEGYK